MKRRPQANLRPQCESVPDAQSTALSAADGGEKKWQFDGPSGLPAPVIRANMISFRLSYEGRVKVAFFEPE